MNAWIARDPDGGLRLYTHKPHRVSFPGDLKYWEGSLAMYANEMELYNPKLFKNLKWEDEPLKVEIKVV